MLSKQFRKFTEDTANNFCTSIDHEYVSRSKNHDMHQLFLQPAIDWITLACKQLMPLDPSPFPIIA